MGNDVNRAESSNMFVSNSKPRDNDAIQNKITKPTRNTKFERLSYNVVASKKKYNATQIQTQTGVVGTRLYSINARNLVENTGNDNSWRNLFVKKLVGDQFYLILSNEGVLYSHGESSCGGLGIGSNKPDYINRVQGLERVNTVECGYNYALCETANGDVYMWGSTNFRQCCSDGSNILTPKLILQFSNIRNRIKFTLGKYHALLLTEQGLYAWGHNSTGRCGIPPHNHEHLKDPTLVPFSERFIDVVAGGYHTVALTESNRVVMWGTVATLLGREEIVVPSYLNSFENIRVKSIFTSSSAQHTMFITEENKVYATGYNSGTMYGLPPDFPPTEVPLSDVENIGNISVHDQQYFVIYAKPCDEIYVKLFYIRKFYDVGIVTQH